MSPTIEGMELLTLPFHSAAAGNSVFAGTGSIVNLTGKYNSSSKRETAFVLVQLGEQGTHNSGGSRAASLLQLRRWLRSCKL